MQTIDTKHKTWIDDLQNFCLPLTTHPLWSHRFGICNYPVYSWYLDGYTAKEAYQRIFDDLQVRSR